MTGAVRSTGSSSPVRIAGSHTCAHAGPGHAGVRDDGLLFGAERDDGRAAVGHRHRALDARRRRCPHLGDLEVHRRLERLRELQQQLVERERAREAAAERAQHLVGRVPFAVDAAGRELGEPFARRAPTAARRPRPRASRARAASSRSPVGRVAEAEHDEEVRRRRPAPTSPASVMVCTSRRSMRTAS